MTNAIPRKLLIGACINAIEKAEETYINWTPNGYSMRVAPESFVQMMIAQELFAVDSTQGGVKLLLEASVAELLKLQKVEPDKETRTGRIDLVVYYKSKAPRLLIEVKKITKKNSLNEDLRRVLNLMAKCKIQNGVLVGYGVRSTDENLDRLFKELDAELKSVMKPKKYAGWRVEKVRMHKKSGAITKKGERNLHAVVYKVSRPKPSDNLANSSSEF